ncbi:hypothetical protein M408DRAFT_5772 [Serendipita vermifera MAFF 305830]|uniref:Uncharacterized protein n=1 Tax=Serendipita vermifera MAFF 305830 TaxID=933852 RepID=A0A0C3BM74_SERVB|nr:hypothetical protein M408DRAFT_5772 [Serendipita vermifera MAFF 305830]
MSHNYVVVPFVADDGQVRTTYQPFVSAHPRRLDQAKVPEVIPTPKNTYKTVEEVIHTFELRLRNQAEEFGSSQWPAAVRRAENVQEAINFIAMRYISLGEALLNNLIGSSPYHCVYKGKSSQRCRIHERFEMKELVHGFNMAKKTMRSYLCGHLQGGKTNDVLALQQIEVWVQSLLQDFLHGTQRSSSLIVSQKTHTNTVPIDPLDLSVQYVQHVLGACSFYSSNSESGIKEIERLIEMHRVLAVERPPEISNSIIDSVSRLVGSVCYNMSCRGETCKPAD